MHKCLGHFDRDNLWYDGQQWRIGKWKIVYCPYCGEKLEPLDVKIEINKGMLYDWIHIMDQIIQNGDTLSSKRAVEAARAIEAEIYD